MCKYIIGLILYALKKHARIQATTHATTINKQPTNLLTRTCIVTCATSSANWYEASKIRGAITLNKSGSSIMRA